MSGAILFATDAWIRRLGEECNKCNAYREAAKNWEGDIYFVVEAEGRLLPETVYMYLDLYRGRCRQAFVPEDHTSLDPEFWICGPISAWKEVTEKKLDPLKALLTRKLSLRGDIAKMMRSSKATQALINCSTRFETRFPI